MNKKIIELCAVFFVFGFLMQNCTTQISILMNVEVAEECLKMGAKDVKSNLLCYHEIKQDSMVFTVLDGLNPASVLFDSWLFHVLSLEALRQSTQNKNFHERENGI